MFEDGDLAFYLDWQTWRRHYVSDEDEKPRLTQEESTTIRKAVNPTARFNHYRPHTWETALMKLRGVDGPSVAIVRFDLAFPGRRI